MYFKTMQEINYFFEQQNKDLIFFSIFFPLQMSRDEVNDLQGCHGQLCSGPKDSASSRLVKKIVILEKDSYVMNRLGKLPQVESDFRVYMIALYFKTYVEWCTFYCQSQ